jgi:hypothetical protein
MGVRGRGAMTYLWEHSLFVGIMISPIYGTMQGICGKQNYLSRGIIITYLADMTPPIYGTPITVSLSGRILLRRRRKII